MLASLLVHGNKLETQTMANLMDIDLDFERVKSKVRRIKEKLKEMRMREILKGLYLGYHSVERLEIYLVNLMVCGMENNSESHWVI